MFLIKIFINKYFNRRQFYNRKENEEKKSKFKTKRKFLLVKFTDFYF